ncbi:MAG: cell wall-binding repeat-containing protein, partial [Erysipelotrichaceae bacterium]|nr:cell wall-binding repeat-containing protein [Erysipelotrichaceae bacterium]
ATCEEAGEKTYTCETCGATKVETVDAIDHTYGEWTKLDETQHKKVCANDESHIIKEDHSWNEGVITKDATCEEAGEMTYTCETCGTTKVETIEAIDHDYSEWSKLDDSQHQKVCSNDETHIVKEDHSWDTGVITKEPTCEEAGEMTYTCSKCEATKVEPIDSLTDACGVSDIKRLYGSGRYETSLDIAKKLHDINGNFNHVIIAYGENFPDALSGGYLAAQTNAPIIIVKNDATVEQNVLNYLQNNANHGAKIMILGSSSVVSTSFETKLKNLGMGFNVVRYGGATRFETNIEILKAGGIETGVNGTLFVASANGFADSLSASSSGLPLMIANAELTQDQITFL